MHSKATTTKVGRATCMRFAGKRASGYNVMWSLAGFKQQSCGAGLLFFCLVKPA